MRLYSKDGPLVSLGHAANGYQPVAGATSEIVGPVKGIFGAPDSNQEYWVSGVMVDELELPEFGSGELELEPYSLNRFVQRSFTVQPDQQGWYWMWLRFDPQHVVQWVQDWQMEHPNSRLALKEILAEHPIPRWQMTGSAVVEPWDQHLAKEGEVKVVSVQYRRFADLPFELRAELQQGPDAAGIYNTAWMQIQTSDGKTWVRDARQLDTGPWWLLEDDPVLGIFGSLHFDDWYFDKVPEQGRWVLLLRMPELV